MKVNTNSSMTRQIDVEEMTSNQMFINLFEQAYALGRQDVIDGFHIDPKLAFENFITSHFALMAEQSSNTAEGELSQI
ncbi:hypothetical protein [Rheinheimera sp.]|uniref:hypothetical protein n=1 Tax=Rheinheimera sp. TaxID=1869214 RepID=UPI0027B9F31E|nr:hypothetical protein [Rheinheimera sp.]